jgi:hypothetical protein
MTELLPGMEGEKRSRELSQWFTPPELAVRIVEWALEPYAGVLYNTGMPRRGELCVLEPSAGKGALAVPLRARVENVVCIEIDPSNVKVLIGHGLSVCQGDFLGMDPAPFDLAVMNPPFEGGQTERHVLHALRFANRVVCHCPLSTLAGQARRESLWSKVHLNRLAICSTRPKYGADGGKTDMCTIDVTARRACEYQDATQIEWWP